ncbi:hypothetical protein niasHS_008465 [Heterodera schachtii]|uniref:Uncharacterized protein n=1 Tax=Heterodera schachtii TaxID=97005 RepID=A0ABD2J8F2_HETSC
MTREQQRHHSHHFDQEVPEGRWPLDQLNQHLISLQCDEGEHGEEQISARTADYELGDGAHLLDAGAAAAHRRRAPLNHSGISEDSDYTSDISFPTGFHHGTASAQQHQQQHQANPSVHQFESHLRPHRHANNQHGKGGTTTTTTTTAQNMAAHGR